MLGIEVGERIEVCLLERCAASEERALETVADESISQPADRVPECLACAASEEGIHDACTAGVEQRSWVTPVAGEELVAPFAGEHDLHAGRGQLGNEVQRDAGRERERMITMPR